MRFRCQPFIIFIGLFCSMCSTPANAETEQTLFSCSQNSYLTLSSYFEGSSNRPNNEYLIIIDEDANITVFYKSSEGGNEYDIVHIQRGVVPKIGSSFQTIKVENVGGHERLAPGVFANNFVIPPPASGQITPTDSPVEWVLDLPKAGFTATGKLAMLFLIRKGLIESAEGGLVNLVPKAKSVLGHIFRNAPGHVNPITLTSRSRYIELFEIVANNPNNLNTKILNATAVKNGVQAYTKTFNNGRQIWVHTRNGTIFDAGINLYPR